MRRHDWGHFDRFPPRTPKRPPPKRGIKSTAKVSTWWAQRWIEALTRMSSEYSNRLARGRTYARAGRVHDLEVRAGGVVAKVTGSRPKPYDVKIDLAELSDAAWSKAIAAMGAQAGFAAALLAGEMPEDIDSAFEAAGASLFPEKTADLKTQCSCPDWANPCKHLAATHYVLGEAFDGDPFLLFELRGRTKAQVLEALRAARGSDAPTLPATRAKGAKKSAPATPSATSIEVPSITLPKIREDEFDKPRSEIPTLHLTFEHPDAHAAVLRQLGTPNGWHDEITPADALAPIVRAAADRARAIAMGEEVATKKKT